MTQFAQKQCFHCGNVPAAVDAGFSINKLFQFAKAGQVEYHWTCDKCGGENYFKQAEDPRDIFGLAETIKQFNPEIIFE